MGSRHGDLASGTRVKKSNKPVTGALKESELRLFGDGEGRSESVD
jgi:hypothetical protein